jgi:L-threonylcarbamoyladenylate synthase
MSFALMFKLFVGGLSGGVAGSLVRVFKADVEGLAEAAATVANGGVICYPTDTLYGLGCDPLNGQAVKRTKEAKGPRSKPMPILVKDLATAEKFAHIPERAKRLAQAFWPGPLTIVLQGREVLPAILIPEGKVGIRSPDHLICLDLLQLCSGGLVGTSANLTGKPPARTAQEALNQLGDRVDLILDGGRVPIGVASTVIDLTQPGLRILREGPLGREELLNSLRRRKAR